MVVSTGVAVPPLATSSSKVLWDRTMMLPSPSTPSSRFARDAMASVRVQAWVEEVVGHKLPEGDFAQAFKDGQGLCNLINAFRAGTIPKIETSTSPFKQMANISAFIQGCRTLGVREHSLFETLDLFNEKRLPQVVRCLFSLSEVVKTTIPEYHGPYLSAQEKPEVHPAVKAVVDIAKGNIPAPGWERTISGEPNFLASAGRPSPLSLIMPLQKHVSNMGSGCLSPAAHAAGQLTYGVYEGGGTGGVGAYVLDTPPTPYRDRPDRPDCKIRPKDSVCNKIKDGGVGAVEQGTEEALAAQREVHDRLADAEGCGAGSPGDGSIGPLNVEYGAGSTLPVMNTPRVWPSITPRLIPQSSSVSSSRYPPLTRMLSASTPKHTRSVDGENSCKGTMTREEEARRRREATARTDSELEVALWIEGVTGVTFPGKFWSSLKDGVLLCKLVNTLRPGLIPRINSAQAPFPEMENIAAFLAACRTLGVAEHSLFDTKDLHEKRDLTVVVRCMHMLGATVQTTVTDFKGPFLGKKSDAYSTVNARGLRKQLGKGPGARGGIRALGCHKGETFGEIPEHTATITPAASPSGKRISRPHASPLRSRVPCPRQIGDSAAGSAPALSPVSARDAAVRRKREVDGNGHAKCPTAAICTESRELPSVILEEVVGKGKLVPSKKNVPPSSKQSRGMLVADAVRRVRGGGARRGVGYSGVTKPADGSTDDAEGRGPGRITHKEGDDDEQDVVSQIQAFVEGNTRMPWRVSGNMFESLRDGWQLVLLANALRPGAVRRVHNSIIPSKHTQNIANFLVACRRMGVARALLFDIDDLYANCNQTRVARTLLALRALAADPDFASSRPSSLMGSSLLAVAGETPVCTPAVGQ